MTAEVSRLPITKIAIDFEARSAVGAPIATFGSVEIAAAWVEAEGARWPGYRIERVRRTERRDVLFSDEQRECAA